MVNEQSLAVIESTVITPAMYAQSMEDAVAKAKTFTSIVESQKLYTRMGPGKHLHVEAWQTIAMGYGLTPGIKSAEILYDAETRQEIGAKATSVIYDQTGTIRGGAEAYCMRSERNWGSKPVHQLLSMAGTRAVSKGLRLLLAWVVVLAGYNPTPYEEMGSEQGQPQTQAPKATKPRTQTQPRRGAASTTQVGQLMQRADTLLVHRAQVMQYIKGQYKLDNPLDLDEDQYRDTLDWLETEGQKGMEDGPVATESHGESPEEE